MNTRSKNSNVANMQSNNYNIQMADMEKVSVGKLLRSRRNEPALTQRQATDQVGVTEATISRRKSGNIDNMRRDNIAGLPVH